MLPILESRLTGRSSREHAELLGLMRPPGDDRFPRLPSKSIALGLATALVTGSFLLLTRDRFLEGGRLEEVVAGWGVAPEQILLMLIFMVQCCSTPLPRSYSGAVISPVAWPWLVRARLLPLP